jgi:aminobenzoyl-glutamate utilization protein B
MIDTDRIVRLVEGKQDRFFAVADRIWDLAETRWQEHESMAAQIESIGNEGFRVETGIAGIPTAFMAEAGTDGPVIAILGEYDALAGLSQTAGSATQTPAPGNTTGNGHGCGHNLLGTAGLMAAVAVKDYLASKGLPGRVRYYGCPAEEGGSSKTFMARAGTFADVDAALSWHPGTLNTIFAADSLANIQVYFRFAGRASHAAGAPHLGRSALDAVELMSVGVNYMREHMPSDARIHYAYTDAGGIAPNVVQARAEVLYLIRARDLPTMNALFERVKKIAEGAALMTETTVQVEVDKACSNLLGNDPLERAMYENLRAIGGPVFDDADRAAAAPFHATVTEEDIASGEERFGTRIPRSNVLHEEVLPWNGERIFLPGSTDVGDVSWLVPTAQVWTACYTLGTPGHSWQLVGQGKLPAAHKGMTQAAKVMAATAIDAILDPAMLAKAKADHAARIAATPYVCPIPADVVPPCSRG